MVAPRRTRLESSTIGIAMTLRSWLRAGLIKESMLEMTEKTFKEEEYDSSFNEGEGGGGKEVVEVHLSAKRVDNDIIIVG